MLDWHVCLIDILVDCSFEWLTDSVLVRSFFRLLVRNLFFPSIIIYSHFLSARLFVSCIGATIYDSVDLVTAYSLLYILCKFFLYCYLDNFSKVTIFFSYGSNDLYTSVIIMLYWSRIFPMYMYLLSNHTRNFIFYAYKDLNILYIKYS